MDARAWPLTLMLSVIAACGHDAKVEGGAGAMKLPVAVVTLQEAPIPVSSEYLAQLVSRHQVAIFPQVLGDVAAIYVKPGDVVKQGVALLQIDPRREAATLNNNVAAKGQLQASLDLATATEKRTTKLLHEGLVTQQQFDQDKSQREVAEHQLRGQEATISAQQTQVAYYRILAPFDGVVGDIPVKLGDFVTQQTKLTSIGENKSLEAYVNVPADKVKLLTERSRVQILDSDRVQLSEAAISFVAEEANVQTQAVLIKAAFPNDTALRASQIVRVRVVWSTAPGLRIPTTAVTRLAGQFFVFVAESAAGGTVAHQRPVTLGDVDDNRFVVLSGLKPGEKIIVTQIQKLRDGASVDPQEQPPPASASVKP